jgi:CheY-like chemotaxis protein
MSDRFRVLIVDDHQDIRTVLKANLETLEADLDLVDVPTGEEAIVEVVGTGVDLLIADVGLPGLSGIDLYRKLISTYPDMKVILITGLEDEDIRKEIAELDIESFFFKPLKMPEFLNSVRLCLGLEPVEEEVEVLVKLTKKALPKDVTNRIADLRGELGAISIMVIDEDGAIGAETGILPDSVYQTHVIPLLINTFQTSTRISYYLGSDKPNSTLYLSGDRYDVFWSLIDQTYGMVIITNPIEQKNDLTWVMTTVDLALQEVEAIISGLGKSNSGKSSQTETSKKKSEAGKGSSSKPAKAELPQETSQGSNGSSKAAKKSLFQGGEGQRE